MARIVHFLMVLSHYLSACSFHRRLALVIAEKKET